MHDTIPTNIFTIWNNCLKKILGIKRTKWLESNRGCVDLVKIVFVDDFIWQADNINCFQFNLLHNLVGFRKTWKKASICMDTKNFNTAFFLFTILLLRSLPYTLDSYGRFLILSHTTSCALLFFMCYIYRVIDKVWIVIDLHNDVILLLL